MGKKSYLTVTDMFCGAGGSSQGVRRLENRLKLGIEVSLAMNHWKLAIETHNTNFPNTLHDCTDISACDPRRYPSTDIAVMSPECTTHSPAGGNNHKSLKKQMDMFESGTINPATERSRATMWDVCRFAEYHDYNAIIVENVVEAKTGWVLFDSWLNAMHNLGYNHKCVYLNSMHHHPTPQSRDRMYVVFWKKGNKAPNLEHTPESWCPACERNVKAVQVWKNSERKFGKYKSQYLYRCPVHGIIVEPYYYASANIIDWTDLGTKIGDRPKGIAEKSRNRIQYGLDKYGDDPFIFPVNYSEHARGIVKSTKSPLNTQTTFADQQAIVNPFLFKLAHTSQKEGYTYSAGDVIGSQTTRQELGLIVPYIIEMNSTGECKPAFNPTSTITAGGINHAICSHPLIADGSGFNSFMTAYNGGSHCTKHISEESGTYATGERMALVNYKKPNIDECFYRMIKPKEVKLGMAFDQDYVILGTSKEQVKQCGNAVTPPAMEWLVERVAESLN
jgi:DNA (cytosine-5)-methyltransferase 1